MPVSHNRTGSQARCACASDPTWYACLRLGFFCCQLVIIGKLGEILHTLAKQDTISSDLARHWLT